MFCSQCLGGGCSINFNKLDQYKAGTGKTCWGKGIGNMAVMTSIVQQLENRAGAVMKSREENFDRELKMFYDFIDSVPVLKGILLELKQELFDLDAYLTDTNNQRKRFIVYPDNYLDKIRMCVILTKKLASKALHCRMFINITASNKLDDICSATSQQYFYPVYEYFRERIQETNTTLYLLDKYRHRTEWFHKQRLYEMWQNDTTHGEDNLTKDLQEYLHGQGIDFPFSTPHSPSGRSDLVGLIDTSNPLVLEAKIFNLDSGYDKSYLRKGLMQAYRYSLDYGKPIGYLLIFNVDEKDISFEIDPSEPIKSISIGNTTIFIVTVNLFPRVSASKEKKPLPYIIEDSYLKNIEEAE